MFENVKGLGIILVDHGSRYPASNDMLVDVAKDFQAATGISIVEVSHMEIVEPTLGDAFARCVERGATRIVIQPYFLAPGRHSTSDIPSMTEVVAARFPDVPYCVAEPLGVDRRISEIMAVRIVEAMARQNLESDATRR